MEKPPNWKQILDKSRANIFEVMQSEKMRSLIAHAQEKYAYWDTFKHYTFPTEIKSEEAWALLKLSRLQKEPTPAKSKDGSYFGFSFTKSLYRRLNFIDVHGAGFIKTLAARPSPMQKDQLIISGLSEEAIASSQIEGASTSRKVAKEMIYSGRKPRTRDEQMIINNYQVMQRLDDLKELDLSEEILLEIQRRITKDTLDDPRDSGRFRKNEDDIVVSDGLTGEIVFTPPTEKEMRAQLAALIAYANKFESAENDFIHPVIKATVLHFWLSYLHPFPDGNGRTARALFYWYLMKRGYWLFQYLSVSRVIKASRKRYDEAFLHTELDDNDLTYFILYITDATCTAIEQLLDYYDKKVREIDQYKKVAKFHIDLNERQVSLLAYFRRHPDEITDMKTHKAKHGVVYETARRDLMQLEAKGFLAKIQRGNRMVFLPNLQRIRKLLK